MNARSKPAAERGSPVPADGPTYPSPSGLSAADSGSRRRELPATRRQRPPKILRWSIDDRKCIHEARAGEMLFGRVILRLPGWCVDLRGREGWVPLDAPGATLRGGWPVWRGLAAAKVALEAVAYEGIASLVGARLLAAKEGSTLIDGVREERRRGKIEKIAVDYKVDASLPQAVDLPPIEIKRRARVVLPIRLPSFSNTRYHHMALHRVKDGHKTAAALALRGPVRGLQAPLRIVLTRIGPKRLDPGNIEGSFKGIQDGVAAALHIDDGDPRLKWVYEQRCAEPDELGLSRGYGVVIEVWPEPDDIIVLRGPSDARPTLPEFPTYRAKRRAQRSG